MYLQIWLRADPDTWAIHPSVPLAALLPLDTADLCTESPLSYDDPETGHFIMCYALIAYLEDGETDDDDYLRRIYDALKPQVGTHIVDMCLADGSRRGWRP